MAKLLELFISFAKVGLLTFGGGYAMIPVLKAEVIDRKHWLNVDEMMDYYAIGQCAPGIIAVNTAIFIGYKLRKEKGGIVAALGMAFPSLVIILIIALMLNQMMAYPIVGNIFTCIRIAVCALILDAAITMIKKGVIDVYTLLMFGLILGLLFTRVSPIPIVVGSAILGIVIKGLKEGKRRGS